ncbi:MAG TPA: nucleotidyltransferase domain-containing protein [Candidatus Nanoarchaeia archaeon]|nr:nucleotidyltransferase domain-containing protein [Candidatus Nanoarchaeia archaeon]
MGTGATLSKSLKSFKKKVNSDIPIKEIILFGSRAQGKGGKYSDVDLIIVSPKFKNLDFVERGMKMYDYWSLDLPVDFLCYTPSEFTRAKQQASIVREAMKKGVRI